MILKLQKQKDYELIDSGDGEKLERCGSFVLRRPDPEALWNKKKELSVWNKTDLKFEREGNKTKWIIDKKVPKNWNIDFGNLKFIIKPTSFKHIGIFPEQLSNWQWMSEIITNYQLPIMNEIAGGKGLSSRSEAERGKSLRSQPVKVLNLFAYTGGATIACAKAGATVCHVDSSKVVVDWAKENAKLSGLEDAPIRWIIDDVTLFLKREVKRGRKYDAIIMDPPAFGHGPKDELWKIEKDFLELMNLCRQLLSDDPLFVLMSGYTAGYSSITYENNLKEMMKDFGGKIESGELVIEETDGNRLLPCGIFARWSKA